jgi:hypothetical protein
MIKKTFLLIFTMSLLPLFNAHAGPTKNINNGRPKYFAIKQKRSQKEDFWLLKQDVINGYYPHYPTREEKIKIASRYHLSYKQVESFFANYRRRNNLVLRPHHNMQARNILQSWFDENIRRPYPSIEEKKVLCEQTGLTTKQLTDWFINARRRLDKKEIKKYVREQNARSYSDDDLAIIDNIFNPDVFTDIDSELYKQDLSD